MKSWKVVKRKWSMIFTTYWQWHGKIVCLCDFPFYFELPVFEQAWKEFITFVYTLIGLDNGSSPFLLCSQQSLKLKRQFFWKWNISAGTRAPGRQWAQTTEASCTKCSPKNARNRILQEFAVLTGGRARDSWRTERSIIGDHQGARWKRF